VIAILALQALALEAQGKTAEALGMLARALVLAEPEVFVRVFADEGAPMAALLVKGLQAQQQGRLPAWAGVSPDYARSLVAAIGLPAGPATTPPADHSTVAAEPLVEPLSAREIEVLRLVAAGQSNQEIAQTLILGVTTVKTHLNNIYGKLEVRSRTEAVARARELHLLA
jgi:LuxR family maltose regulon positive regulatory protein